MNPFSIFYPLINRIRRFFARSARAVSVPLSLPPPPPRSPKSIVADHMAANPEAWDGVQRATYAYHDVEFPNLSYPHHFLHADRQARCTQCNRSREQVRWDNQPMHCLVAEEQAKTAPDIRGVIRAEEAKLAQNMERAKPIADSLDWATVTGAELAHIHQTYGIDPDMLECAAGRLFAPGLRDDYERAYEEHRAKGRASTKKVVLVAKTAVSP